METLKEVQEFFEKDRYATENGAVVEEVADGYARCSMELTEHHMNAMGSVMGGAIFTLADFAFAVATNWNKGPHVALSCDISFVGRAKGTKLIAEAKAFKQGRRTDFYLIEVTDDLGNKVAHISANSFAV